MTDSQHTVDLENLGIWEFKVLFECSKKGYKVLTLKVTYKGSEAKLSYTVGSYKGFSSKLLKEKKFSNIGKALAYYNKAL